MEIKEKLKEKEGVKLNSEVEKLNNWKTELKITEVQKYFLAARKNKTISMRTGQLQWSKKSSRNNKCNQEDKLLTIVANIYITQVEMRQINTQKEYFSKLWMKTF
jgi:hypothetical protein